MSIFKSAKQSSQEKKINNINLPEYEANKLKEMLISYCEIYYSNLPILNAQNRIHLNDALDWVIKQVEENMHVRTSSNGSLVMGDGTWLANYNNYFNYLIQSKPDISSYLNQYMQSELNKTDKIYLADNEVAELKQTLIDYCQIYYSNLSIFNVQNISYLDEALNWTIAQVEQKLCVRTSSNGSLVMGDGTWLANSKNYFDCLTHSKPDIGSYLNQYVQNELTKVDKNMHSNSVKR